MIIFINIAVFCLNILIAKYQAHRFDYNQKRISHTLWAIGYCVAIAPIYFTGNLWLLASAAVMHLPVFNTALNWSRKETRPIFYTHPEDPQGSKLDQLWGKHYPLVFVVSCIIWAGFEIKTYL